MGLDMYLFKTKKVEGYTMDEIVEVENATRWMKIYALGQKANETKDTQDIGHFMLAQGWFYDFDNPPEKILFKEEIRDKLHDKESEEYKAFLADFHAEFDVIKTKVEGYSDRIKELAAQDIQREEAGYWRKANHIHQWFVEKVQDGVDDCGEYPVTPEQLLALKEDCRHVLNKKSDAKKVLPTASGFFFGDTSYDEYYYENLKHTVDIINKALKDTNYYYSYSSSW